MGPALRPDERRLGLAALQRHVAGNRGQRRGCSDEGQGRQPHRRVHVPARWVRALFGADGRRDLRERATRFASAPASRRSIAKGTTSSAVTVETENGTERIEADNYISSIPLTVLAKIMEPAARPMFWRPPTR